MKKILLAMLAATIYWQVNAAENTWLTDLPKAQAQAKSENKIVLLELDFPHKKTQADDLKKANAALQTQYDVHSFPTLVVLDKNGKQIGHQVGYTAGGPKAFIAKLEKFRAK